MSTETSTEQGEARKPRIVYQNRASEAVYGFGLLGAWFYYLTTATSIGVGALGIIKGIIWPAMLVYELMKSLGM